MLAGASKNEIVGWENGFLKIKIKAVAEKGKANLALIAFLAEMLHLPKSQIQIIKGHKSNKKTLLLSGLKLCPEALKKPA